MKKKLSLGAWGIALLLLLVINSAYAEDSYTLRNSTELRQYDYAVESRATLNLHADDLPLPGAYIDIRNIELHTMENRSLKVENYDKASDCMTITATGTPEWVRFGYDFFQLPPTEQLIDTLKKQYMIGNELDVMKDQESQKITLKMTPRGKFISMDFDLPEEARQKVTMFMPSVMEMISGMIDPIFPENPVKTGESWTQNVRLEMIPVVGMSNLSVTYKLENVEKNEQGDLIGVIHFDSKWHYDIKLPESVLENQKIPYWEGKEFEVIGFRPHVDLRFDGNMRFNITKGAMHSCDNITEMVFALDADLKKSAGHAKNQVWSPHAEYKVIAHEKMMLK